MHHASACIIIYIIQNLLEIYPQVLSISDNADYGQLTIIIIAYRLYLKRGRAISQRRLALES